MICQALGIKNTPADQCRLDDIRFMCGSYIIFWASGKRELSKAVPVGDTCLFAGL